MTRFTKLVLAAALGGTMLGGAAYAAQDQAAPPAPMAGMHRHHHGHGDMFAKLDANHDGVVTRDEAIAAATQRFDKMDANHDGKIDQAEVQAMKATIWRDSPGSGMACGPRPPPPLVSRSRISRR